MQKKRKPTVRQHWKKLKIFIIRQFRSGPFQLSRKDAEEFAEQVVAIFERNFRHAHALLKG